MSVRPTADTIWMHRNSTYIVRQLLLHRSNVRASTSTVPTSRARLGLSSSGFDRLIWKASSTTRTTRTYNPYDALRREEEVLREQDSKRKSSALQSDTQRISDVPLENVHSPKSTSVFDFEYSIRTPLSNSTEPIASMQVLQGDDDNFEPITKSRSYLEKPQTPVDKKRLLVSSSSVSEVLREDFHADELDILRSGSAEAPLNLKHTWQYLPHTAVEIAFFEKKDHLLKSLLRTRDLIHLRQAYLDEYDMAREILQSHETLQVSQRITTWENSEDVRSIAALVIGSCLSSAPEALSVFTALSLGDATCTFDFRVSFLHLIYVVHKETFEKDSRLMTQLDANISNLRDPVAWPDLPIKLDFVLLLMNRFNDSELHSFISDISTKYYDPGPYQCRFYARLCLGKGWTEIAFEMLRKLRKEILQTPQEELITLISRLIKLDTVVDGMDGPNFRFLSELLQKGLVLDAAMYSRIIERALELEHPNVAWDLYHHLKASGHEIESRTYLLMLQHSFITRNEQAVTEIMSEMHTKKALYTDPKLLSCAMNIIRNVCFFHQKMDTAECMSHILALYDRAYTRAPLIRLGILTELGPREHAEKLPEPDTYMLCFVLWAYILCHRHVPSAMKLWERIHQRIQKGDTAVVECMTMDFLYNAYILLYRRSAKTLPHALEMFQYMLEKRWCLPSERTWAIIILGFVQHGQPAEARELMELMYAHGFTNQNFDPFHLPRGVTMERLEAMANTTIDEILMPDGSDPLQNQSINDDGFAHIPSGVATSSGEFHLAHGVKDDAQEQNFEMSSPFARLIST